MYHTLSVFDEELRSLTQKIAQMGGFAEQSVADAVRALSKRDLELAKKVMASDVRIDALQKEVEDLAIHIIAKRQPVADDLRLVVAAMRIASDLERIGDLAKNIAKRAVAINADIPIKSVITGVDHLCTLALQQVKDAIDSYLHKQPATAQNVWGQDSGVDVLYTSIFRELLTYMMEDPRNITHCTHLLFTAKNLERIGDHATNIAETAFYMATGDVLPDARPKGDTTAAPAQ